MNLTPRQLDVVVAVRNYRHLHGVAPTMQELADVLGCSKVTIFEHCAALERKRVITRTPNVARSIAVRPEVVLPDDDRSTKLPLLGDIAAGNPIRQTETREELDLEQLFAAKGGVYTLRVRGESMIDEHLCDGDYVIVEHRNRARSGETVVALVDGTDATVRRLYHETGGRVRLQPANKTMEPVILAAERVRVQGVVIGVLRSY